MMMFTTNPEAGEKGYRWLITAQDFEHGLAGGDASYFVAAYRIKEKTKEWLYTTPRIMPSPDVFERLPDYAGGELYHLKNPAWVNEGESLGILTVFCFHNKKSVTVADFFAKITDKEARQAIGEKDPNQNAGTRITNPPNIWLDGDTPLPAAMVCEKNRDGLYQIVDQATICFDPVAAEEANERGTLRTTFNIRCPFCAKHKIDADPAAFEQCLLWLLNGKEARDWHTGEQRVVISLEVLAKRYFTDVDVWKRLAEINATGIDKPDLSA